MYILYYLGTLGLDFDILPHIGVNSDIPTKVTSSDNAEYLVVTSLAISLVEPPFLSRVRFSLMLLTWERLVFLHWSSLSILIIRLLIILVLSFWLIHLGWWSSLYFLPHKICVI